MFTFLVCKQLQGQCSMVWYGMATLRSHFSFTKCSRQKMEGACKSENPYWETQLELLNTSGCMKILFPFQLNKSRFHSQSEISHFLCYIRNRFLSLLPKIWFRTYFTWQNINDLFCLINMFILFTEATTPWLTTVCWLLILTKL